MCCLVHWALYAYFQMPSTNDSDTTDQGVADMNFWYEWIFKYIYIYPKNDANEYPNKYLDQKYLNIRLYSSLSGLD